MSNTSSDQRKRVLSGMRPTGKLHLGNYMGALYNWVRLQHEYECYFFIADWHALTTDYADPSNVKKNTLDVALDWLAAGLDPEKCTIFIQSHVPQHAELHLAFSMMTPLGWLERVPTYKEQMENLKGKDLTTYGFLGYPLLQSADILVYQAQYVPVGQDQVAHVELTREVARRFHSIYKTEVFPEPEALLTPSPKLPGIDGRKMSKSYGNTIGISESPMMVATKVHSMSTNGQRVRQSDPGDPDLCPVGDLHKVFSTQDVIAETQKGCRTATMRCEICKIEAGRSVVRVTDPIHSKREDLESKVDETWEMLLAQADKAAARAEETMIQVRAALNITRDLGSLSRRFGLSAEKQRTLRDLSVHRQWLALAPELREREVRQYWQNNVLPYDISLSQETRRSFASLERELEEPLLTVKKKRVLVRSSVSATEWHFQIPAKTYEVWVLLCWDEGRSWLHDLVLPQGVYSQMFAKAKKTLKSKNDMIAVTVQRDEGQWSLQFSSEFTERDESIDVTPFLEKYDPLQ